MSCAYGRKRAHHAGFPPAPAHHRQSKAGPRENRTKAAPRLRLNGLGSQARHPEGRLWPEGSLFSFVVSRQGRQTTHHISTSQTSPAPGTLVPTLERLEHSTRSPARPPVAHSPRPRSSQPQTPQTPATPPPLASSPPHWHPRKTRAPPPQAFRTHPRNPDSNTRAQMPAEPKTAPPSHWSLSSSRTLRIRRQHVEIILAVRFQHHQCVIRGLGLSRAACDASSHRMRRRSVIVEHQIRLSPVTVEPSLELRIVL